MCGIAGFINSRFSDDEKRELTKNMLSKIAYRGPDATSVWVEGRVALGHNRLKIIDLSDEANQPFEYDDVVIVFNGEVYNYIEVREELVKRGFTFRTQGDTEVICAAYKLWGENCVKQFMGMWSFALWDKGKKKLFCSRDRFGIKPFYYINFGEGFYFASEYKPLKDVAVFKKELNLEQFNRGLQLSWAVYKDETYYTMLKSLRPGHNLVWANGKVTITQYWDIDFTQPLSKLSWAEKKDRFFSLFKDSIRLHSRSDVQNGTCLSGGLDSSAIASMYSTLFPDSKIKSFSIYYENDVDERPFVREVINKYPNIQPHYFSPSHQQILDNFHNVAFHSDVPLLGSSFISQYFLMQLAKSEGVTVALDGQGSDEYMGGYLHSFYRLIGQDFRALKFKKGMKLLDAHVAMENYSKEKRKDILKKSAFCAVSNENRVYNMEYMPLSKFTKNDGVEDIDFATVTGDKFNNFLYHLLMNSTLQTLLHYEDRNSMAFSIESRVPFLDHRLVEFAFTLMREDRISDNAETKYILREALRPILPKAIAERKDKKGFVTPGEVQWLNGPLKFLLDINYEQFHWLKADKLRETVEQYKRGDTSKAKFVWRLACADYWLKNFN
ncbi:MAG TPA: asparagine synthase (glutamine-hydrolyzing) [Chitinophagales bacterium]|nr:asparagine synthase (glutamine-hydrolyzing) [Chitinophagales bacterium]